MNAAFVVPREELERLVFLATPGAIVMMRAEPARAEADAELVVRWRRLVGLPVTEVDG